MCIRDRRLIPDGIGDLGHDVGGHGVAVDGPGGNGRGGDEAGGDLVGVDLQPVGPEQAIPDVGPHDFQIEPDRQRPGLVDGDAQASQGCLLYTSRCV